MLMIGSLLSAKSQNLLADFEDVTLPASGFLNGSGQMEDGFQHSGIWFSLQYNSQLMSWSGFGVSNKTDTSNGSYANQYSCYAGKGANGSEKYSIAYTYNRIFIKPSVGSTQPLKINSFYYSNSTWVGKILKNGDSFSKKFGGVSGNDPDYFRLRVFNYFGGQITDSADVYLADYRFADNSLDYVVKDWRLAEFNFSNPMDSLGFSLQSTDVGQFGMNTPSYFCLDNVNLSPFTPNMEPLKAEAPDAFPNPFKNQLVVRNLRTYESFQILDVRGKVIQTFTPTENQLELNLENLPTGLYFLKQNASVLRILKK